MDDSGWTDLFDGQTLNGWVHLNGSHRYTVEDGAIVGRTVAGSRNSFLCTKKEFGDFELELEVMVDSVTNSGIQIRSKVRPFTIGEGYDLRAGRVNGPQVEMQRNHRRARRPQVSFMVRRWGRVGFPRKKKFKTDIIICTMKDGTN